MTQKQQKEEARKLLEKISKNHVEGKMNTEFVGITFNEKGNFYSALITLDLVIDNKKGQVNIIKEMQIPINLTTDVSIYEETKKEHKPADEVK